MSLKPPSIWIEKRGHQHRVYWRNGLPGLPTRSYVPFYGLDEAEQFVGMAALPGLATARQVLKADPDTATALLHEALAQRGLALAERDAAAQLFVSPRTVDFHLRNVFSKLGVTSRAELTALAIDL